MTVRDTWPLLKETYNEWDNHDAMTLSAALSYYTVLSLAPLLIVVLAVIGLVLGSTAAHGQIMAQLQSLLGAEGARAVDTVITNAQKPATGIIASILGIVTLFISASGVFNQLRVSLNRIWDVHPKSAGGILATIRQRFLSFGMLLAVGFLLLVSLVLSAAVVAAGKYMGDLIPIPAFVLELMNLGVSLAFITVLFALIFRFLPDERVAWGDVWLGAFVTSLLFTIGKFLIGLYIGRASFGSAYGAAGSLVVVLVWVYYSAIIFFFGAVFTHVYATSFGSLKDRPKDDGAPVVTVPLEKLHQPVRAETEPKPQHAPAIAATPPHETDAVLSGRAARAAGLIVVATLGGLGWWKSRADRREASR